jgi:2-hydroxychromene-2-carboxylate isomerase
MLQKLARRHGAQLALYPVAEHGIAGDPDLPLRRAYAITDAARLLRRRGDSLLRTAPLQPTDVAFLAAWAEAARDRGALEAFTTEAMAAVWQSAEPSLEPARFRPLYQRVVGAPPPDALAPLEQRVTRNAARLRSRGHWETPAARIAGEWFFAHEREEQMSELLSELKA